ncbi:MAG: UDP-N-acetylmuramoyl-tripeptide--D-alanyl-D-alanine ligase [Acidobacteriota bacterium]
MTVATLSLGAVAAATGGAIIRGHAGLRVNRYSIDSRQISGGELFFAITGQRHDGHRFLEEAFRRGAAAAVVSGPTIPPGPAVRVQDTTGALRALASTVRRDWGGTVIGVTGSCGKTTTKEMLRLVLEGDHREILATRGNLNNLFGLPLMLLELLPDHEIAVLEMGISTPGEMTPLARIARPDIAILLNVEAVHLVHFPSLDAIAAAKAEMLQEMGSPGTLVFNADDPRVADIAAGHHGPALSFSLSGKGDVVAHGVQETEEGFLQATIRSTSGSARLRLAASGRHTLLDALAATTAALAVDVPLAVAVAALTRFTPVPMRGQRLPLEGGVVVWDESYNSNPCAMRSVLAALGTARAGGRKVVVCGDMLELGPREAEEHEALALAIAAAGTELFIGIGPLSSRTARCLRDEHGLEVLAFPDVHQALRVVVDRVQDGDLVMVKGSRGMATELVVAALKAARGGART